MTPILEGLGGGQKMSKSLNNAIGVTEPPFDMFGKVMQVGDELMWKYYTYLTDLTIPQIDALRDAVAAGTLHPMQAKKDLARIITAGFHSEEAATRAEENWSTQFQKGGVSDDTERVTLLKADLGYEATPPSVNTDRLVVSAGLAPSMGEARRKRAEKAVKIGDESVTAARYDLPTEPVTLTLRLGKRVKLVTIE